MNKYYISFKTSIIDTINYKFDFFLIILYVLFPIMIQVFIWSNVFSDTSTDQVFGYQFGQLITYTILSNFVNTFITTNVHFQVGRDIKSGALNGFIVKPTNYIGFRLAGSIGKKVFEFLFLIILLVIVFSLTNQVFDMPITITTMSILALLLMLSLLLNFFLFLSISLCTFWITECTSLFGAITIIIQVLSGTIFPLDIYGRLFVTISNLLPFKYMVYVPIRFIIGKINSEELIQVIGVQCMWIVVFWVISVILWKRGMKRYSAVGG